MYSTGRLPVIVGAILTRRILAEISLVEYTAINTSRLLDFILLTSLGDLLRCSTATLLPFLLPLSLALWGRLIGIAS